MMIAGGVEVGTRRRFERDSGSMPPNEASTTVLNKKADRTCRAAMRVFMSAVAVLETQSQAAA